MALGSGRAAACGGLCLAAYALHLVCLREGSLREEAPLGQASLAAAAAAAAPVPARSVRGFSSGPAGSRGAAGEGAVAAVPASEARGPAGGGRGRPRGNGTLGSLDVERVAWLHPPKAGILCLPDFREHPLWVCVPRAEE
ncbi:unnamed protein product [Prorocentrum cordatum]|uniref:Uncharacterized protein n=1 Tax=Prorocentrum cordatum TaxID=2364126 RepID=A0ABN9UHR8_9DINO|nr:unnamed protein product [Polarella glacialis]